MRILTSLLTCFFAATVCRAQVASDYAPIRWYQTSKFEQWEALRPSISPPVASGRRPVLLGVTGKNLELLQDAVARKYSHITDGSSLPAARNILSETTSSSLPKLRGYMAEALFLDAHPEWKYVSSPNASQHDVYAPMPNGRPGLRTGQIKFHINGKSSTYAREMLSDNRSGNFFVPDDHVDELRTYLRGQADRFRIDGNASAATTKYRDMNRVKGIGYTAEQIDKHTRKGITEARILRASPYVFMGVISTLVLAPTAWDYFSGNISSHEAINRVGRGGTVIGTGIATDLLLKRWKGGLYRGTVRGNAVVACAVLLVDTGWQIGQYGGFRNAIHNPDFLINIGGNISAMVGASLGAKWGAEGGAGLALALGQAGPQVATPEEIFTVPIGATIGGLAGGLIGGGVGHFGGAKGARWIMVTFCPEKLYEEESKHINNVRNSIDRSITSLQTP